MKSTRRYYYKISGEIAEVQKAMDLLTDKDGVVTGARKSGIFENIWHLKAILKRPIPSSHLIRKLALSLEYVGWEPLEKQGIHCLITSEGDVYLDQINWSDSIMEECKNGEGSGEIQVSLSELEADMANVLMDERSSSAVGGRMSRTTFSSFALILEHLGVKPKKTVYTSPKAERFSVLEGFVEEMDNEQERNIFKFGYLPSFHDSKTCYIPLSLISSHSDYYTEKSSKMKDKLDEMVGTGMIVSREVEENLGQLLKVVSEFSMADYSCSYTMTENRNFLKIKERLVEALEEMKLIMEFLNSDLNPHPEFVDDEFLENVLDLVDLIKKSTD